MLVAGCLAAVASAAALASTIDAESAEHAALSFSASSARSASIAADDAGQSTSERGTQGSARPSANRLVNEKSPYLLLHARNPVDWYPWGPEAFDKARREGKPIFLSIGYSTCHWCHVMEAETFADPSMADLMNRSVVSIKVDREERPDVDRVYMRYVVAATGGGGWPMSLFLTSDLRPFFGATYLPPDDRNGRPGFRTLLTRMAAAWAGDRRRLLDAAKAGAEAIEAQSGIRVRPASSAVAHALDQNYRDVSASYDSAAGGFGPAPKFPRPVLIAFLLRHYARTGTSRALDMAVHTLRAMADGGIHDHLGGGFHRYSTDGEWRVPHFEKMLYDQAQLAIAYTEGYQITKNAALAGVARDILDYVLRDMRGVEGGFLSAEDADSLPRAGASKPAEGAFYVWTADEIRAVVDAELADVFAFHYGVQPAGNVLPTQDIQGELRGRNVLTVRHTVAETATRFGTSESEARAMLETARRKLVDARAARPRPPRDDKVLVAWNGMMMSAFARASQVLDEPRYLDASVTSAIFIHTRMYDASANLLTRRYRDGEAAIDGMLEDYAFLIEGLLDLYEASFDVQWLSWAVRLQEQQDRLFWDSRGGAYFSTRAGASDILVRIKDDYDGTEPSPNSVAAMNLLRLWQMTDRKASREKADGIFKAQAAQLTQPGMIVPRLAVALDFSVSKPRQIVIAGEPGAADTRAMLRLVHDRFMPNKILLLAAGGERQEQLAEWLPFVKNMDRIQGRATAYICENYVCRLPTNDLQTAARLLDGARRN